MKRVRRRDTTPERKLRSILHRRGLRFRVDYRPLADSRTRADIVLVRHRIAIFVDGCFWHGCPRHGTMSKTNATWWREKIRRNRERDRLVTKQLTRGGWTVVRFWEHRDLTECADAICELVLSGKTKD
jgi:DNA mismatch endonuclease (patch repair protein)